MNKPTENQQRFEVCFSEILKELIEENKTSIGEVSARTRIPISTLYDWVNNLYKPRIDWKIAALAKYFNRSVDFPFFGVDFSDQNNSDNPIFNMSQTLKNVDEDQVKR